MKGEMTGTHLSTLGNNSPVCGILTHLTFTQCLQELLWP